MFPPLPSLRVYLIQSSTTLPSVYALTDNTQGWRSVNCFTRSVELLALTPCTCFLATPVSKLSFYLRNRSLLSVETCWSLHLNWKWLKTPYSANSKLRGIFFLCYSGCCTVIEQRFSLEQSRDQKCAPKRAKQIVPGFWNFFFTTPPIHVILHRT